jgi:hypothetical protein
MGMPLPGLAQDTTLYEARVGLLTDSFTGAPSTSGRSRRW